MKPLVSVILPVCNSDIFLNECLVSLLKQKYSNLEVIAVDDSSKDQSLRILKRFRRTDKRLKFSSNVKRYGLAVTLNRAIRKAQGEFIAFMNPNDTNSVWRIKKQLDFLMRNPKVVAVGTQTAMIDANGKTIEKKVLPPEHDGIYEHFLQGLTVKFETLMINRLLIPKDILYFKQNKYPFIYIETLVQLFKYGKFANHANYLYYHRGLQYSLNKLSATELILRQIQMTIKSFTQHDYRPSLKSLFTPYISRA